MRFNYDLLISKAVVIVAEQNYESEHILAENYKLKKIYIKNTKVIPNGFCFNDISLEKVIIDKNTEEIRSYAFENCLSLKKIYIPKTI